MKQLGLTANALAKAIGVPPNRITAILKDKRGITGDTTIPLGTFFKTSAEFCSTYRDQELFLLACLSISTTGICPWFAACHRAVRPFSSLTFTSAPLLINNSTISE